MKVLVLNGPSRSPGPATAGDLRHHHPRELARLCATWGHDLGLDVEVQQTNHEGELLDWLNTAADDGTPVVLNAGAWTHYSLALWTPVLS